MASRVAKPRVMPFGTSYPGFQPGGTSDATYEGTSAIFYNILNLRFEIFVIYHSFTTLFHHFYLKFQTIFTLSHWDFPQLVLMKESNSSAQRCRNINVAGLSPPPATKSLALSSFLSTVIGMVAKRMRIVSSLMQKLPPFYFLFCPVLFCIICCCR